MRDLLEIRNEIDELDDKIVELYERRMQLTTEVAEYKIETLARDAWMNFSSRLWL